MPFRHSVGTCQGNELTCKSSGNARPQSAQLAEPLWTDHGFKSRILVHELISPYKKSASGNRIHNLPPNTRMEEKATYTGCHYFDFYVILAFRLSKQRLSDP